MVIDEQTGLGAVRRGAEIQAGSSYDPLDSLDWGAQVTGGTVDVYFGPAGYSVDGYTSEGFNAYEIAQFETAFDRIEAVVDLSFNIVSSAVGADFRLVLDTDELNAEDSSILGFFYPPGQPKAGIGVFNGAAWDRSEGAGLEVGGYHFVTIVHEILHGLGLAHPHDAGGQSTVMDGVTDAFGSYGTHGLNQGVFTALSYNSGMASGSVGQSASGMGHGYEAGPMALDIGLLQSLYGANATTAAGNDIYHLPDANAAGTAWTAIWDTGGRDTIRYDGARDVTIDLRPATLLADVGGGGYLSAANGIAGGYTVANGVVIERAQGGSGNDTLLGSELGDELNGGAGDDTLQGHGGDDLLNGGGAGLSNADGADSFIGGAGNDWVSYASSFGSLRVDLLLPHLNTFAAAGDSYSSIENVIGSRGRDNIRGDGGDNEVRGGGNSDFLYGRGGNDTLNGGVGNDVLFGGTGADVLIGGAGRDRAQYSQTGENLVIDLQFAANNSGEAAGDSYHGIEDLAGGAGNDLVFGSIGGGNRLFGREGADKLYGRSGDDYLNGGSGGDRLDGGVGDDTLRGGTHADTFVFNHGNDVIEDFSEAQQDRIAIDDSMITAVMGMSGAQVVDSFAQAYGSMVIFDFGNSDTLTLAGVTSTDGLGDWVLVF